MPTINELLEPYFDVSREAGYVTYSEKTVLPEDESHAVMYDINPRVALFLGSGITLPWRVDEATANSGEYITDAHVSAFNDFRLGADVPSQLSELLAILNSLTAEPAGALTWATVWDDVLLDAHYRNCVVTLNSGDSSALFNDTNGERTERLSPWSKPLNSTVTITAERSADAKTIDLTVCVGEETITLKIVENLSVDHIWVSLGTDASALKLDGRLPARFTPALLKTLNETSPGSPGVSITDVAYKIERLARDIANSRVDENGQSTAPLEAGTTPFAGATNPRGYDGGADCEAPSEPRVP